MTTRELIEAVREPKRLRIHEQWSGDEAVDASDYDALRAACRAVLDEVVSAMEVDVDTRRCAPPTLRAMNNARALMEKL